MEKVSGLGKNIESDLKEEMKDMSFKRSRVRMLLRIIGWGSDTQRCVRLLALP